MKYFSILSILIISLVIFGLFSLNEIKAGPEHNVSGWAWSENIGWISFNSINTGGPIDYGVNVDFATGNFSGYTWSESIGWVDFGPGGPYPADPQYSACLDLSGVTDEVCDGVGENQVSGWARALAGIGNGIAGLWHFDEGSGNKIYDSSTNGNTGTIQDNGGDQWTAGQYNSGIQFDGVDDTTVIPASPSLSDITTENGGLTLETWIKMDTLTGLHYIIDKCGDGQGGYCWAVEPQDPVTLDPNCFTQQFGGDYEQGGSWLVWSCGSGPNEGEWTHIAVTYSSSYHLVFYKNGEIWAEGDLLSQYHILPSPTKDLILGYNLDGTIDELIIYNRVLSPYEIKKRYEMGPLSPAGGWDGWIKLRGTVPIAYGVSLDPTFNEFSGWAWGGDPEGNPGEEVVGWMSFNCKNEQGDPCATDYKVFIVASVNNPPSAMNLDVTNPSDYCFYSSPPITLNWEFSDPDAGDTQSAYQVQVDDDSLFGSIDVDSGKVSSSSTSYVPLGLSFNTTYYWQVMVWDSSDTPSAWAGGPFFTTSSRPPWSDFTWNPTSPVVNDVIQFTDATVFSGAGSGWAWDFGDDVGTSSDQHPTYFYSIAVDYSVTLTATDSNGSCPITYDLTAGSSLPEWKEIAPIGWLSFPKFVFQNIGADKFLASILGFLASIV